MTDAVETVLETDLSVGPSALDAYSRLSYTMWHALAEFIDNSTQSRLNYGSVIDSILAQEGKPLEVKITHDRVKKKLTIEDNSVGMNLDTLLEALKIAHPTRDSRGRSKYGLGMKTAACWIGAKWKIVTTLWASGEELTADIDVAQIAHNGKRIPVTRRKLESTDAHGTTIIISDLHRNIQKRTEETIVGYLGSMYRFDLQSGRLKLLFNNVEVKIPDDYDVDSDPAGQPMRREIPPTTINGKGVSGWVAVLRRGGRKFGGFSLFQHQRQIQGFPNAWKPRVIFGGVDDEGANNLISQRLTGIIQLDGFDVSHTKDAIRFCGDEEEELEKLLYELTKDYRDYATKRRGTRGQPWSREKVRDLLEGIKREFAAPEMQDAINTSVLPPLDTILANNAQQASSLTPADTLTTIDIMPDLRVVVSVKETSEYEPHLTILASAEAGKIHVIINGLHPYYSNLESSDAVEECIRQYIYDAVSEYRVSKLTGKLNPNSVRRLKNDLLRVQAVRIENAATAVQEGEFEAIVGGTTEHGNGSP